MPIRQALTAAGVRRQEKKKKTKSEWSLLLPKQKRKKDRNMVSVTSRKRRRTLMGKRTPLLFPRALSTTPPLTLENAHKNSHPPFSFRRQVKVQKSAKS
jgi:hypothetical protein